MPRREDRGSKFLSAPGGSALEHLLDQLSTTSSVVRGREFEELAAYWLRADPIFGPQVAQVWHWPEWPERDGPDMGIDIVVTTRTGETWAVQCKGYSPTTAITKAGVDSFLSASGAGHFTRRILIASTDLLSPNARRVVRSAHPPVTLVTRSALDSSSVAWPRTLREVRDLDPADSLQASRRRLREHQKAAVENVTEELNRQLSRASTARASLVMACGSGKTLTCHGIFEEVAARRTLVLVPSLALLSQTMNEWHAQSAVNGGLRAVAVCSDATVGRSARDDIGLAPEELPIPVTTAPDAIAELLAGGDQDHRPLVVFSTYQSSRSIADAIQQLSTSGFQFEFDLTIADEAHYLAGRPSRAFATVLANTLIPSRRRVFTTATPKLFTPRLAAEVERSGESVASMDNVALFGPVAYRLTFAEAIELKLLADYKVLVLGVAKDDAAAAIEIAAAVHDGSSVEAPNQVIDSATFAGLVAVGRAVKEHGVRTAVTFHSRVARAESFASLAGEISSIAPSASPGSLTASYVSGAMPSYQRSRLLRRLHAVSSTPEASPALLANARCLSTGVDLPALDAVAFVDPRQSVIDIVQAVGRALRTDGTKSRGLIIVPVVVSPAEDPEAALDNHGFEKVWQVLAAMRDHDERLAEQLDALRTALGRGETVGRRSLDHLVVELPSWASVELSDRLVTQLVEVTSEGFAFVMGELHQYVESYGTARVPASYKTASGFSLGKWISKQRNSFKRGTLSPDRAAELERLPGWVWDPWEQNFNDGLARLLAFVQENGHSRVTGSFVCDDGYRLGQWVEARRIERARGALADERIKLLENVKGWAWEVHQSDFLRGLNSLTRYVDRCGTTQMPSGYTDPEGFRLQVWVTNLRKRYREGTVSADKVEALERVDGWCWDPAEVEFATGMTALAAYAREHGHCRVPAKYETSSGFRLGSWVSSRRLDRKVGRLSMERSAVLDAIPGWEWDPRERQFQEALAALRAYVATHGSINVASDYRTDAGVKLARWIANRRIEFAEGRLSAQRVESLEALPGWSWS